VVKPPSGAAGASCAEAQLVEEPDGEAGSRHPLFPFLPVLLLLLISEAAFPCRGDMWAHAESPRLFHIRSPDDSCRGRDGKSRWLTRTRADWPGMGQMRRNRDYLPLFEIRELELVTRILFAAFQGSLVGGTAPHRQAGRSLKLVLLGYYKGG
jgi:hypothetical protein